MEQSVTASNAKAEAYKNRITTLEQDLFRARVSRAEVENNASHVRWDTINSRQ
jgi:hypothetical protein